MNFICVVVVFLVPKGSPALYSPSFLESVIESHLVMAQVSWLRFEQGTSPVLGWVLKKIGGGGVV